jgi:hypothetical protein
MGNPPRSIGVPRLQLGGTVVFGLGLILTFAVSLWFSLMVDLGLSAVLLLVAIVFARYQCERCAGSVHFDDLVPREQKSLRVQQALALGLAAAFAYGAVWSKARWDAERGIGARHHVAPVEEGHESVEGAEESSFSESPGP